MTKEMVHWQNDTDTGKQKYFQRNLSQWISQATINFSRSVIMKPVINRLIK